MRHALLEVDQFAGILELIADDPAAAEPHLRRAYNGFRRMGLDADTAETAALLGRACLALDRDAEADELCTESERLAGHALKASIAWRTVRAQLLSRSGDHGEARRVAEAAVAVAERTDALVDHGDACLALATVLEIAGDAAGARAAAERAVGLYELKGAAALAEMARSILGVRTPGRPGAHPKPSSSSSDNACVRVERTLDWPLLIARPGTTIERCSHPRLSSRVGGRSSALRDRFPSANGQRVARRSPRDGRMRHRPRWLSPCEVERLALTRVAIRYRRRKSRGAGGRIAPAIRH